jgi:hypothetical protein
LVKLALNKITAYGAYSVIFKGALKFWRPIKISSRD